MKHHQTRYGRTDLCSKVLYVLPFACVMSFCIFEIHYLNSNRVEYQDEVGYIPKTGNIDNSENWISKGDIPKIVHVGNGEIRKSKTMKMLKNSIQTEINVTPFDTLVNDYIVTDRVRTGFYNKDYIDNNTQQTQVRFEETFVKDSSSENSRVTEAYTTGPGDFGKPVIIHYDKLTEHDKVMYDKGWSDFAFNEYVSRIIPIERQLPDVRDPECLKMKYPDNLPSASIVITFHNEAWSVLLRSVHSILNRSPAHLITEIILVDDFSTMDHLKSPLENYMAQFGKIKIVRGSRREGLIRARLLGFTAAKGPVVIFLDSHIECTKGWLEPLLERISKSKTTVAAPAIDIINDDTFQHVYQTAKATNIGGFDWSLTFKWQIMNSEERIRRKYKDHLPIRSPTMAGGLFAISREFFEHLGTYDEGMDFWGGENLELSFRIWMCGGTLETIPCSHVGHVFRKKSPYKWKDEQAVVKRNNLRLADVWMDDFKFYYFQNIEFQLVDFGNVSSRKALRKRLQCNDFNWYLTHVYTTVHIPAEALNSGEIHNKNNNVCLDGPFLYGRVNKPLQVYPCHGKDGPQYWLFTPKLEIRHEYGCFDFDGHTLLVAACHGQGGNQKWLYKDNRLIYHIPTGRCIELSLDGLSISMTTCTGIGRQQWLWSNQMPPGPVRLWQ